MLTFKIRRVPKADVATRSFYASMLRQMLYASGIDPQEDIDLADAIFVAESGDECGGFVLVSKFASPDEKEIGEDFRWIENTVVEKQWRRHGVADALEYAGRDYLRKRLHGMERKPVILRAAIDKRRACQLERNGWARHRETFDCAVKKPTVVYQLPAHVL